MKRKVAAGGVVVRSVDNVFQALLVQHQHKGWGFPKGHIDQGESFEATALREVEEETGVLGAIVASLSPTHYIFTNPRGKAIDKTVHWFLMKFQGIGHQTHAHEIIEVKWIALEDIPQWLSFDNDQVLFREARECIPQFF